MKRRFLLFTALFAFILNVSGQDSIIKGVFEEFVENKIERMQKFIDFDDKQADELKKLELNYLLDVNKAEHNFWCRTKKRIKKLNKKREKNLKLILSREQYIKYNSIDNKLIEKEPPIQV